ncbi:MAG: TA system VapC family ribonuclease toxin [Candidatus Eremiobacterota bacterium]
MDSNVLVYGLDTAAPLHDACSRFRDRAARGEVRAWLTPSVLHEFFAVVTDSRRVSRPLDTEQACQQMEAYRRCFRIVSPGEGFLPLLVGLLRRYRIRRQDIFDATLVATMVEHGATTLYTADSRLQRFQEIEVELPA